MVSVDYTQLAQGGELLHRQAQHAQRMQTYVDGQCRLSGGDLGLVLQALHPLTEMVTDLGVTAADKLGAVCDWGGDNLATTLDDYVEADRAAYEDARTTAGRLGTTVPGPFQDPRSSIPALGPAAASAPAGYGQDDHFEYNPVADAMAGTIGDIQQGWDAASGTADAVAQRLSLSGGVLERTDPSSYLVPVQSNANAMEDLSWKAGLILGSVDHLAELFIGFSILERYVFSPLAGDWKAIDRAAQSWTHEGQAYLEMATNVAGLPRQIDGWSGLASEAFTGTMSAISAASVGLSYACDIVSGLIDKVKTASYLAASGIASALQWIANKLTRMLLESSIPIAGWITAGLEATLAIQKIFVYLRMINTLITMILDAISDLISGKEKLAQAALVVGDLAVGAGVHARA